MLRSLRPLAKLRSCSRTVSTLRVVESSDAARSLALPLCFLSVTGFDSRDSSRWHAWIDRFASKGYSSLVVDLDPELALAASTTSEHLLSALERELVSLLRDSSASPFPPLLFASAAASLVAETYVSSHPLSGLVLDRPLAAPLAHSRLPAAFKTPLAEFDYEPFFPVAVVEDAGAPSESRLASEFGGAVDDDDALVRRIDVTRDDDGWRQVMDWMDENGL
ncbi:hypothetical protein JCM11491_001662 [Sporobolomyces phaffii]